jgi:hypothetical protein
VTIAVGGAAAIEQSGALIDAGCSQICASTNEVRRAVRSFILQRARSRLAFGALAARRYARENG